MSDSRILQVERAIMTHYGIKIDKYHASRYYLANTYTYRTNTWWFFRGKIDELSSTQQANNILVDSNSDTVFSNYFRINKADETPDFILSSLKKLLWS